MSKNNIKNQEGLVDTLVSVNRVTKVVKGGRNFSFAALVVVGDKNGKIGFGTGKAKEVSEARVKATKDAKNKMVKIPMYQGRTIHHDVYAKDGAAKVILRRASPGTGVIAGGVMRAIFYAIGIEDIVAKSLGSTNPSTLAAATLKALLQLSAPKMIALKRNKSINQISSSVKEVVDGA